MDTGINNYPSMWPGAVPATVPNSYGATVNLDPSIQFFANNGVIEWRRAGTIGNLRDLYDECAPLAAILSRKADAFASGVMEVLNATTGNYTRGAYKAWDKLFAQPNALQGRRQFMKQVYSYIQLYGWCFCLKAYPAGITDIPASMWVLPNWCIEIDSRHDLTPYNIKSEDLVQRVYFVANGRRTLLKPEQLMLFTDDTVTFDENTWLPKSRVVSLSQPITVIQSAVEAEVTMIQRRGALGILSNVSKDAAGGRPLSPENKQELQEEWRRYGLTRDQWQVIVTNAGLTWQSMTFPTKDLLLQESYLKACKDLCNRFNFPFPLLAHSDQSTYNNIQTADRLLYQNTIMPEAKDFCEQLSRNLKAPANNVAFNIDYSEVPALQQSMKDKADGQKATNEAKQIEWEAGRITLDDWSEALGDDRKNAEPFTLYKFQYDKWMRDNGYVELPQTGNNENKPTPTA